MKKSTKILIVTAILTLAGLTSQEFATSGTDKVNKVAPIEKLLILIEKSFKEAGGSAEGVEAIKSARGFYYAIKKINKE